jgi:hypothetical protein
VKEDSDKFPRLRHLASENVSFFIHPIDHTINPTDEWAIEQIEESSHRSGCQEPLEQLKCRILEPENVVRDIEECNEWKRKEVEDQPSLKLGLEPMNHFHC